MCTWIWCTKDVEDVYYMSRVYHYMSAPVLVQSCHTTSTHDRAEHKD